MPRLKPTTSRAVDELAQQLLAVADAVEPARPFLAEVYRSIAKELPVSLIIPDAPFRLAIPEGATAAVTGGQVTVYPPDFDNREYHKRLIRRSS